VLGDLLLHPRAVRVVWPGLLLLLLAYALLVSSPPALGPGSDALRDPPRATSPDVVELWATADRLVEPILPGWDPDAQGYRSTDLGAADGPATSRINAEMLLVHSQAALADHEGAARHDDRVVALVRRLVERNYVPTLRGRRVLEGPGTGDHRHAPGFSTTEGDVTMHPSFDAVAMRALAAAWRARDRVDMPDDLADALKDAVSAVGRSAYWGGDRRTLNQINWNVDVYEAYADVTGDPTLLRDDYREQLTWFLDHARAPYVDGGTSNLSSGLGLRYVPTRPPTATLNRSDSTEYANIVVGALGAYDRAVRAGMAPLSPSQLRLAQAWLRRTLLGGWTGAGLLNWDTGLGKDRLYLTQYWVHALRGMLRALEGTRSQQTFPQQQALARGLLRSALRTFAERVRQEGRVEVSPSFYGMTGSALLGEDGNLHVALARLASVLAAADGDDLASGPSRPLPSSLTHDGDLGRLTVSTSRYATAIVRPFAALQTGGIEPARLFDDLGRGLTSVGGRRGGTLGLRIQGPDGRRRLETQPGSTTLSQSLIVPGDDRADTSGDLGESATATATDSGEGVRVELTHEFREGTIQTTYRIVNHGGQTLTGILRLPTAGGDGTATIRGVPMRVGLRLTGEDLEQLPIVAPSGGRYVAATYGLPDDARGTVDFPNASTSNPGPGPQLQVRFGIPPGRMEITRLIGVPATDG